MSSIDHLPHKQSAIKIVDRNSSQYSFYRDLVSMNYLEHYGAKITPQPDVWAILNEPSKQWLVKGACFGVYFSNQGQLFSEQYLDNSIEESIFKTLGKQVSRSEIVECGSFSSFNSVGAGKQLVAALPMLMLSHNIRYSLVTVTPVVRSILKKLNIPFHPLCQSDLNRLSNKNINWGTYYNTRPITGVIDNKQGLVNTLDRVFDSYKINELSSKNKVA